MKKINGTMLVIKYKYAFDYVSTYRSRVAIHDTPFRNIVK